MTEPNVYRIVVTAVVTVLSIVAAGHVLLHKRDPRAAFGWIAVCLLFPLAGPTLYVLFGVNATVPTAWKSTSTCRPERAR